MNKKQLKKDLSEYVGGAMFMTPGEIGRFLGLGRSALTTWLYGLDYTGQRRGKRYAIDDVAGKILQERTMGTWSE